MSTALAVNELSAIETVLIQGDLMKFTPAQRIGYYKTLCESAGINPLTRPFDYLTLNGKLVLYANRGCTDQLRKIHSVSITKLEIADKDGLRIVTAYACDVTGRTDASIGAVNVENMRGLELANAYMKAETKAKRRVTLSICGLGVLDETEVDDIQGDSKPKRVVMDDSMPQAVVSEVKTEPATPQISPTAPNTATPEADAIAAEVFGTDTLFSDAAEIPEGFEPRLTNAVSDVKKTKNDKKFFTVMLGNESVTYWVNHSDDPTREIFVEQKGQVAVLKIDRSKPAYPTIRGILKIGSADLSRIEGL